MLCPNQPNVLIGEYRRVAGPTLGVTIGAVDSRRAKEQVTLRPLLIRLCLDARRVVAVVEDMHPRWDRTVRQLPCNAGGLVRLPIPSERPVAVAIASPDPEPAAG